MACYAAAYSYYLLSLHYTFYMAGAALAPVFVGFQGMPVYMVVILGISSNWKNLFARSSMIMLLLVALNLAFVLCHK